VECREKKCVVKEKEKRNKFNKKKVFDINIGGRQMGGV
jgi:hypothetical protein